MVARVYSVFAVVSEVIQVATERERERAVCITGTSAVYMYVCVVKSIKTALVLKAGESFSSYPNVLGSKSVIYN